MRFNGGFNYDGVVNGSDYTLIDNAFNTQGSSLAAIIAPAGRGGALVDSVRRAAPAFASAIPLSQANWMEERRRSRVTS